MKVCGVELTVTKLSNTKLALQFPFHNGLKNEVKISLEGAKWNPDFKIWECRNCARNNYVINHVWQDSEQYNRYFKTPPSLIYNGYNLWPNQRQALEAFVYRKRIIYAGVMGSGKMLFAFAAMDYLMSKLKTANIWWTTSEAGFKAFEDEYTKWRPLFYPKQMCTYQSLPSLIEKAQYPPQIWVVDECSAYKTISTIQTQAALSLVELMEQAYGDETYVLLLSGTPEPKDKTDWWSQCEIARPGYLRESNIYKFIDRYALTEEKEAPIRAGEEKPRKYKKIIAWREGQEIEIEKPDENGMIIKQKIKLDDEALKLPKRLNGLVLRHDERDLPINIESKEFIIVSGQEFNGHNTRILECLKPTASVLQICQSIVDSASNALVALQNLRQFADGFQYSDEGTKYGKSPKLTALKLIASEHKEHGRIIIYAAYTAAIDKLTEEMQKDGWAVLRVDGRGWYGFNCPNTLEAFQNRLDYNYPIAFIAHPRTGGEAITLSAADSIHFYSNTFRAGDRWQAQARTRFRSVKIYDYLYLPTDFKVYNNLMNKKEGSDITLNEIRELTLKAVKDAV